MKNKVLLTLTAITAAFSLAACGGGDGSSAEGGADASGGEVTTIRVGATPVPHARILEFVDENLAADAGIDLEIEEFDDYQIPNRSLSEESIDANYFQHLPFLQQQIDDLGYDLTHGEGVHLEPYAAFSEKYASIDEIPDGATIGITNDPGNQPRALKLLEQVGLLNNVEDDASALALTAEQNPKGLKFEESQPEFLAQVVGDDSIDLAIINGNYFLDAGLNVNDALAVESTENSPYANVLAWRTGDDNPAIQTLDELLHSQEVADFIEESWPEGEVIPVLGNE